jgi:hypothetical protein
MPLVISKDGTSIAYEAVGTGHAVVLVCGGLDDGDAAAASVPADKLAIYEVPYNTADEWPRRWVAPLLEEFFGAH